MANSPTPATSHGSASSASSTTLLSTTTIAGAAAPFNVIGIAQTANDLILVLIARASLAAASDDVMLQFNGDTANNYLWQMVEGANATAVAQNIGATNFLRMGHVAAASATANYFGYCETVIPGYTSTSWMKSTSSTCAMASSLAATAQQTELLAGIWISTAAITQVTIKADDGGAGNFAIGSTLRIYSRT